MASITSIEVGQRDVVRVRAVPAAPAEVIADLLLGHVLQRVIQRLDALHAVLLVRGEAHLHADAVPERREPRVVDLHEQAGLRDRLVFHAQRVGERVEELFLARIVLVRAADLDARGRGRRDERVRGRVRTERRPRSSSISRFSAASPV